MPGMGPEWVTTITPHQAALLNLVLRGTVRQAADRLGIAERSAASQVAEVRHRMGASSIWEVRTLWARYRGAWGSHVLKQAGISRDELDAWMDDV